MPGQRFRLILHLGKLVPKLDDLLVSDRVVIPPIPGQHSLAPLSYPLLGYQARMFEHRYFEEGKILGHHVFVVKTQLNHNQVKVGLTRLWVF